jgi:hypothetical protein
VNPDTFSALRQGLATKLDPKRYTAMSGKMAAIVGYVLGEAFTDPEIAEIVITSDNAALARHEGDVGCNAFLGSAGDLADNWNRLLDTAELADEERKLADAMFLAKTGYRRQ